MRHPTWPGSSLSVSALIMRASDGSSGDRSLEALRCAGVPGDGDYRTSNVLSLFSEVYAHLGRRYAVRQHTKSGHDTMAIRPGERPGARQEETLWRPEISHHP